MLNVFIYKYLSMVKVERKKDLNDFRKIFNRSFLYRGREMK